MNNVCKSLHQFLSDPIIIGICSSLIASIIFTIFALGIKIYKISKKREILLKNKIENMVSVYLHYIEKINILIKLLGIKCDPIYEVYNDNTNFLLFIQKLKDANVSLLSDFDLKNYYFLFQYNDLYNDLLSSSCNTFTNHSLYIEGLLSKREYKSLPQPLIFQKLFELLEKNKRLNSDTITSKDDAISLLNSIIIISSKIINIFEKNKNHIIKKEEQIKDNINHIYFSEIYSHSDNYIEKQLEDDFSRNEYYWNHPDENDKYINKISCVEEQVMSEIMDYFFTTKKIDLEKILSKINSDNTLILQLLSDKTIRSFIKSNPHARSLIEKKYGKHYWRR